MKTLNLAVAVLALSALPLAAQSLDGAWITEFERSLRNENGVVSGGEKVKARITIQQKGDSLFGTWELADRPVVAGNAQPRRLLGTRSGDKGTLAMEVEALRNIDGAEEVVKMTVVYDFTVKGDVLEGTSTTRSADSAMPSRPFSATRETK